VRRNNADADRSLPRHRRCADLRDHGWGHRARLAHSRDREHASPALPRSRRARRALRGKPGAGHGAPVHLRGLLAGGVEDAAAHRSLGARDARLAPGRPRHRLHRGERLLHVVHRRERHHHRRDRRPPVSDARRQRLSRTLRARRGDDERLGGIAAPAFAPHPRLFPLRRHRLQQGVQGGDRAGAPGHRAARDLLGRGRRAPSHPDASLRGERGGQGALGPQVGAGDSRAGAGRPGDGPDADRRGRGVLGDVRRRRRGLDSPGGSRPRAPPHRARRNGACRRAAAHHGLRHVADELHDQRTDPGQGLRAHERRRHHPSLAIPARAESVPVRHDHGRHQYDHRERAAGDSIRGALRDPAVSHVHHVPPEHGGLQSHAALRSERLRGELPVRSFDECALPIYATISGHDGGRTGHRGRVAATLHVHRGARDP
jgi:hypothetical protein